MRVCTVKSNSPYKHRGSGWEDFTVGARIHSGQQSEVSEGESLWNNRVRSKVYHVSRSSWGFVTPVKFPDRRRGEPIVEDLKYFEDEPAFALGWADI